MTTGFIIHATQIYEEKSWKRSVRALTGEPAYDWRPLTDDQLQALVNIDWKDDLHDMRATIHSGRPSAPVQNYRKYLKFLAGKGLRIVYTESGSPTGYPALSAWIEKDGRPIKRLVCAIDARKLWLERD